MARKKRFSKSEENSANKSRVFAARMNEWEKLANAATEGPWCIIQADPPEFMALRPEATKHIPETGFAAYVKGMENDDANYAFMAAAREAVPSLIARVRELEEELEIQKTDRSHYAESWYVENQANLKRKKMVSDLEAEANWLAEKLAGVQNFCAQPQKGWEEKCLRGVPKDKCIACWREAARDAIRNCLAEK